MMGKVEQVQFGSGNKTGKEKLFISFEEMDASKNIPQHIMFDDFYWLPVDAKLSEKDKVLFYYSFVILDRHVKILSFFRDLSDLK